MTMKTTKPKSVNIDFELFEMLVNYFFNDSNEKSFDDIQNALQVKIERILAHHFYTKYKSEPDSNTKAKLLQEYLKHKGFQNDD